jgi:hypothetical protein
VKLLLLIAAFDPQNRSLQKGSEYLKTSYTEFLEFTHPLCELLKREREDLASTWKKTEDSLWPIKKLKRQLQSYQIRAILQIHKYDYYVKTKTWVPNPQAAGKEGHLPNVTSRTKLCRTEHDFICRGRAEAREAIQVTKNGYLLTCRTGKLLIKSEWIKISFVPQEYIKPIGKKITVRDNFAQRRCLRLFNFSFKIKQTSNEAHWTNKAWF